MTTTGTPIDASWKISRVLETYPALLDTLVDLTPAFSRLRNPLLRRVQTRLVTVGQAAGIAGIDPADLVRALNAAVGIETGVADTTPDGAEKARERPAWVGTAPVAASLDARPLLERGEEPFGAISRAVRRVPVGSVFQLEAGFEPVPLYDALGRQGFEHWGERVTDDHWRVDFLRLRETGAPEAKVPMADEGDWEPMASAEVTIDVSELMPPEPMMKILATLDGMPDGSTLLVHHARRPIHLYPELDERGYLHMTRDIAPNRVEVLIHKPLVEEGR